MPLNFPDFLTHANPAFPIARDSDLQGGYVSVSNIAARTAIPSAKRKQGMAVSCVVDGVWVVSYYSSGDISDSAWANPANWLPFGGLSSAVTVSDTEPADKTKPWFDTVNAVLSVWVPAVSAWVAVGGTPGTEGPPGPIIRTVITFYGTTLNLTSWEHRDTYVRLAGSGAIVIALPTDAVQGWELGNSIAFRVANGDITSISFNPASPVVINGSSRAADLEVNDTFTIMQVGPDTWDYI